jgi:hypothetical protein
MYNFYNPKPGEHPRYTGLTCTDEDLNGGEKMKQQKQGLISEDNLKCAQRVEGHLKSRLNALSILWDRECEGIEEYHEEFGALSEYGLCFDYVEPNSFEGQKEGYYRYQISWGGPSDEFRFFVNLDKSIHRIEYWFLDWFDGAHRKLRGRDFKLLETIFHWHMQV